MAQEVEVVNPVNTVYGKLVFVAPFLVPGIGAAAVYVANDAMGTVFALRVPKAGAIVNATWHDLDDEGGPNLELWLLREDFSVGSAADNAAFALTDAMNLHVVDVIAFSISRDSVNNQVGKVGTLPIWYVAPKGYLWCQLKTTSTPNIAADAMPRISMVIESYDPDFRGEPYD